MISAAEWHPMHWQYNNTKIVLGQIGLTYLLWIQLVMISSWCGLKLMVTNNDWSEQCELIMMCNYPFVSEHRWCYCHWKMVVTEPRTDNNQHCKLDTLYGSPLCEVLSINKRYQWLTQREAFSSCWVKLGMEINSLSVNTFVPIGVLLLRGLSRQQSGRSTITPPFSKTC